MFGLDGLDIRCQYAWYRITSWSTSPESRAIMLCIWCGWGFSTSQELVQHMAMHMRGDAAHQPPPSPHGPAAPWQDSTPHMAMYMHGRSMTEQPVAWASNLPGEMAKPPEHAATMGLQQPKPQHSSSDMAVGSQEPHVISHQRASELTQPGGAVALSLMKPMCRPGNATHSGRTAVGNNHLTTEPMDQLSRDVLKSSEHSLQGTTDSHKNPQLNAVSWPGHILSQPEPPGVMNSIYGQPQPYPAYTVGPSYGEPVPRQQAVSALNREPLNIRTTHRPHYDYHLSHPGANMPLPAPIMSHQMLPMAPIDHDETTTTPSPSKQMYNPATNLQPSHCSALPQLSSSVPTQQTSSHHQQPLHVAQLLNSTLSNPPNTAPIQPPETAMPEVYPPARTPLPTIAYKEPPETMYLPANPTGNLPTTSTDNVVQGSDALLSFNKELAGPVHGPVQSPVQDSSSALPPPSNSNELTKVISSASYPTDDSKPVSPISVDRTNSEHSQPVCQPHVLSKPDRQDPEIETNSSMSQSPVSDPNEDHAASDGDNVESADIHTQLTAPPQVELTAEQVKERILADLEKLPPYVNPNKCSVCGLEFTVPASLKRHMAIHKDGDGNLEPHKEGDRPTYSCKVCGKEYCHLGSLKKHHLSHKLASGDQLDEAALGGMHRCTFCDKIYTRADKLQGHLLTHKDHFKFKCKVCKQGFLCAEELEEHEAIPCRQSHESEESEDEAPARRTRSSCSIRSSVRNRARIQQKGTKGKANQEDKDKFYCMVCKKTFRKVAALENHVKLFETPSANACSHCHLIFTSTASRKQHEAKHEAKVVYCPSCKKGFKREIYFVKHCQNSRCVRSGRKVSCQKCQETVIFRDYLSHLRSHEGKTMHTCPRCYKSYSSLLTLQKHKHSCGTVKKAHKVERIKAENLAPADLKAVDCTDPDRPRDTQYLNPVTAEDGFSKQPLQNGDNCSGASTKRTESFSNGRIPPVSGWTSEKVNDSNEMIGHKADVYQCPIEKCVALFRSEMQLKRHMRYVHTSLESVECHICKKHYSSKRSLTTHMVVHGGDKKYRCQYCPMAFSLANSLKLHVRRHTGQRPHKCPLCDATYITSNDLNLHVKKHGVQNPFTCSVCPEAFPSRKVLDYHMKIHQSPTKRKTHTCPVCGKTFSSKRTATCHMRTHTGERPLQCQYCQKRFNWLSTYKKHLSTHTGKAHGCPVCHKAFHQQALLKEHMRIHTGERPFICQVCGKAFTNRRCYNQHMRVHGEKRHLCPLCGTKFSEVYYLNRHMKVHADVFPGTNSKPRNHWHMI